MLKVNEIDVFYGDLQALKKVSFEVQEKEVFSIIGANGMGKSTILLSISGIIKPKNGEIMYKDKVISRLSSDKIVDMGVSQVPEGRQLFPTMTVQENLEIGSHIQRAKKVRKETMKWALSLFQILQKRNSQLAGTLSGGEQQMLAIARALMSRPSLLLLDEPSLGLAPLMVDKIYKIVREINQQGTTILMVEQHVLRSLKASNRASVLENGKIVMTGSQEDLISDPHIRTVYLGL